MHLSVCDRPLPQSWSRTIPLLSHRHCIYFSKVDWVYTASLRVSGHALGRQLSHWGGGSVTCGPGKLTGPSGTDPVSLVPFLQGSESALESVRPVKIPLCLEELLHLYGARKGTSSHQVHGGPLYSQKRCDGAELGQEVMTKARLLSPANAAKDPFQRGDTCTTLWPPRLALTSSPSQFYDGTGKEPQKCRTDHFCDLGHHFARGQSLKTPLPSGFASANSTKKAY